MPKQLATLQPETWGQSVRRTTDRQVRDAVDRIHANCGDIVGSRATFLKLHKLDAPPARPQDQLRAWLLLVACGMEPNAFGISDDVLPSIFNGGKLRSKLAPHLSSRGEPESAGQPALSAA